MLTGDGPALAVGRARVAAGKPTGLAIDNAEKGFGELMIGLSMALGRMQDKGLPIAFAQVARYANPTNTAGSILLALLLEEDDRTTDALDLLYAINPSDPSASQAEDAEIRMLINSNRQQEALRRAQQIIAANPGPDAFSRLGIVQSELKNYPAAADAYGRALQLAASAPSSDDPWTLRLYRASALEDAGRWDEAKAELLLAMKDEPDNPLLLNFLGYGKLERGEDMSSLPPKIRGRLRQNVSACNLV